MDDKITIIEGPPPVFEEVNENWASGLHESSVLSNISLTRLRTFNGPALVERCYRAWNSQHTVHLEYRASDGLEHQVPIVAARHVELEEGQLLLLWVRLPDEEVELEIGYEDDIGDGEDDGLSPPDIPF